MTKDRKDIFNKFLNVMNFESQFIPDFNTSLLTNADEFFGITSQILETGYLALIPRVYNTRYGLTEETKIFESVSAHTLLLQTMVDRALSFEYGPSFKRTVDKFNYREIMETIRRHDMPEIIIGDQPDNGTRNDKKLAKKEYKYWHFLSEFSPKREANFEKKVNSLLLEMQQQKSSTGRILYIADKTAAIIMALCCDIKKVSPAMQLNDVSASEYERIAMRTCDRCNKDGFFRASEMWTIDYFKIRELYKYDDSGFFTALIVMSTLAARNKWYLWREQDYVYLSQ